MALEGRSEVTDDGSAAFSAAPDQTTCSASWSGASICSSSWFCCKTLMDCSDGSGSTEDTPNSASSFSLIVWNVSREVCC